MAFTVPTGLADCNEKEMPSVMPTSFHELATFEGRRRRLA